MKTIKSFGGEAKKKCLNSMNKSLGRSESVLVRDWFAWI